MSGFEGGGGGGVREVHKNGWLKKMPSQERRLSVMAPFTKPAKGEKVWVSFCVHDETEGWLEFYENRRSAFSHNPLLRTSLTRCLHVSPAIRVHEDNEHVFAITLEAEVIKLGAQSREQMMEWIDALRSRLRELGVLTPKDNLYSREPEGGLRSPMLRNPASPLPPTPTAFQFPPHAMDFREEVSSLHSLRLGISPAGSITLPALPSMHSLNSVSSGHSSDPNTSPSSVVTYVRPNHDFPPLNRRSSFRASLPSSPTTPASSTGSLTYLRSPPGPQAAPRGDPQPPPQPPPQPQHVTVINVASPTSTIFNFDSGTASTGGQQGQTGQQQYQVGQDGRLMSLREQQVIRLQREIAHQAGVRLTLRKKDCCNTVAFVNVFDHVYVAGWKQREHPYLHNTFHIGDRLMSVCGVAVASAGDVNGVIKNEASAMIEFIIRRVPHGRVFALKRETEGQPLGVVREGNTAEIKEVRC
ncbi:hypothetical protein GWK47_046480 [Chionoecetes opilio]|uniref:PH domain-containing protein n=1 Tax=Chionoecetes opilio TaxID=41210 RepID=A0A8J4YCZ2_CHIOP|nr:hypothetical protein GWK47_046480 [Chionoecetes opilio]